MLVALILVGVSTGVRGDVASLGLGRAFAPGQIISGETERRIIHFTFDDGPDTRTTPKMLDALDETATWPIDGYLIASPYYIRPSQRGLMQHFTALADHASWPIVLYNIPYRTGVSLTNETLLQLALHPNIAGMKDCGADRAQSIDFLARRPPGFRVLTGEDALYHEALADGADGAILLSAHLETDAFASVQTLMKQGDRNGALARWKTISALTRLLFAEPSPAPAKYWLTRGGLIDRAEVRLPMVEVSAELAALLDEEIERRRPPLLQRA